MNDSIKAKIIGALFYALLPAGLAGALLGDRRGPQDWHWALAFFPALLVILHACWSLGPARGLAFLAWAALVGFAAEALSLRTPLSVFGGAYQYHPAALSFAGVPVYITAYWAFTIYMGYALSSALAGWSGLRRHYSRLRPLQFALGMALLDAIVVTSYDLFLDPVMTRWGAWGWESGGAWFGVPLGNFAAWFTITILVTGCFRLFEALRPQEPRSLAAELDIIPLLIYILTIIALAILSLRLGMGWFAAVGCIPMLAISLLAARLYVFGVIAEMRGLR
jgi:putative membrane protein